MSDIELEKPNTGTTDEYIGNVCINGYKHRRIRRLFGCLSPKVNDYDWKRLYIHYERVCFLVWYTDQHPSYNMVIRPAKHYYKIEFEQLFRFSFKNKGYREDRMIGLYKNKN